MDAHAADDSPLVFVLRLSQHALALNSASVSDATAFLLRLSVWPCAHTPTDRRSSKAVALDTDTHFSASASWINLDKPGTHTRHSRGARWSERTQHAPP